MVELIQTDGTAPADYMVEPLMIPDGMMECTTMLMAVEDEMMEDMEMLSLEGRVGDMKTNTVMFDPGMPRSARIMREGVDSGRDTRASVWYKRSVYKRLATTEAPA